MSKPHRQLPLQMPPPNPRSDARALAAGVFERHGITLREDDPAFALVTLNELTLQRLLSELLREVDRHIKVGLAEFELTMQRVEEHAGKTLAQQVRNSAAIWQSALREEVSAARMSMQQTPGEIRGTHGVAGLTRWCVLGAVVVVVVFAFGCWAGRL